jgi:hypothetical protein
MPVIEGAKYRQVAKYTYDFDQQGGTMGNITLIGETLPDDAIVFDGFVDVITPLAGAGGTTAALSTSQAANDLITAAAVSGAPWSSAGLKAIVPVGTVATAIRTTAARAPILVIGTHDLTAGKFHLFIQFFISE